MDKSKYQEHLKSLQDSLPADFIRTDNDVADDLFFNNPITRCFDDLKRKKKSCQKLIILSLEQLESSWVHSRMMQILPMILKDKSAFEEYGKFFMDYDEKLELALCPIMEVYEAVKSLRQKVASLKLRRIVSTRAFSAAQRMGSNGMKPKDILKRLTIDWSENDRKSVGV